jgi:glycosyltransferase involved in cell wall biosynthesis
MSRPFVSVLTPTYNRRQFIPAAIACFKAQTYPQDRMEWIVLDDGTDKVGDLFAASGLKNVRYVALPDGEKLPIGAKRNRINELAKGDICVCWDDDDYYVPDRVRLAVMRLQGQKIAPVAGSTELYLYFPDRDEIWSAGPYNSNHATNGTMAYWRSYFKTHRYDEDAGKAEERKFMDDWKTPVVQLRPEQVMLVINHGVNTVDKRRMIHMGNRAFKKTSLKIKNIVKDKKLRDFYVGLRDKIPPYVHVEEGAATATATDTSEEEFAPVSTPASDIPTLVTEDMPTTVSVSVPERALSLSERLWAEASVTPAVPPPAPEHPPVSTVVPPPEPSTQPTHSLTTEDRPSSPAAEV